MQVLDLDWRTVVAALGFFTLAMAVYAVVFANPTQVTMIVVAVFVALALNPAVAWLNRRFHIPRGWAVVIVLTTLVVAAVLLLVLFGQKTAEQAQSMQDDLPRVLDQIDQIPIVGSRLADANAAAKVQEWLADLPKQLGSDDSQIAQVAARVSEGLGFALLTCVLILALLFDGPLLGRRAAQLIPGENQPRARQLGHIVYQVVGRYFTGSILLGIGQGLFVLITGLALNVPLTPVLAVWAGLTNLLPQIGGALGGIVVVAVALTQGFTTALIMGALFVAYMTFSNNVLLPVVVGRAVNMSPPTTMLAAIGGFAVAGIVGALFAIPIVGATKAIFVQLRDAPDGAEPQRGGAGDGTHPVGAGPPPKPGIARRLYRKARRRPPHADSADAAVDGTADPADPADPAVDGHDRATASSDATPPPENPAR